MAIVKSSIIDSASGRIGNTIYRTINGQVVLSKAPALSQNTLTRWTLQKSRFGNVVTTWHLFGDLLKQGFQYRTNKRSDYNCFVSANLSTSPVYTDKATNRTGQCILCPYVISEGTLNPITYSQGKTDINLGLNSLPETVGVLAKAIVDNNPNFAYGDQLNIFLAQQTQDDKDIYRGSLSACKVELLPNSQDKLTDVLESWVTVRDQHLAVTLPTGVTAYGFTYTRREQGQILASTQRLELSDRSIIALYNDPVKAGVYQVTAYLTPNGDNKNSKVRRGNSSGTPVMPSGNSGTGGSGSGSGSGGDSGGIDTGD